MYVCVLYFVYDYIINKYEISALNYFLQLIDEDMWDPSPNVAFRMYLFLKVNNCS